jgi:hypothetical protein
MAMVLNFGQRPFAYTAPSGYKALCSTNLPTPAILNGATAMDVKLYTGNGSTQTISGLGFSPDLVWIKTRNVASTDHQLYDAVRGASLRLNSNLTNAEADSTPYGVTTFGASSFTVADLANGGYKVNGSNSSETYAAWCWDAGSSTVTNTAGTITSQVRANASAGFSVVTYTGTGANATVGHGLGVAPQMVIVKSRGANLVNWGVYHASLGNGNYILLNTAGGSTADATFWNSTTPTSAVLSLGANATVNQNTYNYVAYCFAPVSGYSAFGGYTGNGIDDGPFVYTGFRPRWILVKSTPSGCSWLIYDTARNTGNESSLTLLPSSAGTEFSTGDTGIDILSNGFKLKADIAGYANYSTYGYIYAAFAENPFSISRAR